MKPDGFQKISLLFFPLLLFIFIFIFIFFSP